MHQRHRKHLHHSLHSWIDYIWSLFEYWLWRHLWRKELCPCCENKLCVGNSGPCYSCHEGSNFEPLKGMNDHDVLPKG